MVVWPSVVMVMVKPGEVDGVKQAVPFEPAVDSPVKNGRELKYQNGVGDVLERVRGMSNYGTIPDTTYMVRDCNGKAISVALAMMVFPYRLSEYGTRVFGRPEIICVVELYFPSSSSTAYDP